MLKIREVRESKGLSAVKVAEYLGISRSAYSQIEKEKYMINAIMLSRLALIFECTTDELIDFEEIKKIYELNYNSLNKIIKGE